MQYIFSSAVDWKIIYDYSLQQAFPPRGGKGVLNQFLLPLQAGNSRPGTVPGYLEKARD